MHVMRTANMAIQKMVDEILKPIQEEKSSGTKHGNG